MTLHSALTSLNTPCLLLEQAKLDRNIGRMERRLEALGVKFRPHVKTAKSVDVVKRLYRQGEIGPITVSTLAEAEQFARAGATDILYAVGIAPNKLDRVVDMHRRGINLSVILDTEAAAQSVAQASRESGIAIPALIEINTDNKRAGVKPKDASLLGTIAGALSTHANLKGVMTHCGGSYAARTQSELMSFAALERDGVVEAARTLRSGGYSVSTVSVGSTPTAMAAEHLEGVTEVRAGVYMFMDLVMHGLGVCGLDEIAVSVLATIIGIQPDTGRIVVDAGWTAMSRDSGTASQAVDQRYGLVCDIAGCPIPDLILAETNQEHGIIVQRDGKPIESSLAVGDQVRILPNHACSTAGQFQRYVVLDENGSPIAEWERGCGW